MSDLGPGSVVEDRYRIDAIDPTAAGTAYRGVALRGGRAVGLVVVNPVAVAALRRATLLAHPNLATLLEVLPRPAGYALAVFEAPLGRSLQALLEVEPVLEPAWVAAIGAAIGDGLAALHQRGAAHGHVHPGAIVLDPGDGRVAVLAYAPPAAAPNPYQSPERGAGAPSPADDVWALTATLHTMLVGAPPPAAGYSSRGAVARAGITDAGLAGLIANCLARRVEQRITLVAPVRDALAAFQPSSAELALSLAPSAGADSLLPRARVVTAPWSPSAASTAPAPLEIAAGDVNAPRPDALDPETDESPPQASTVLGAAATGGAAVAAEAPLGRAPNASAAPSAASSGRNWVVFGAVLLGAVAVGIGAALWLAGGGGAAGTTAETAGERRAASEATAAPSPGARASAPAPGRPAQVGDPAPSAASGGGSTDPTVAPSVGETVVDLTVDRAVAAHSLPSVGEVATCVTRLTPPGAFKDPPNVAWLCEETDPRVGYRRMKAALVRGSNGSLTAGMSLWSRLHWFGMAGVALLRGTCCGEVEPLVLPPTTGCDDTAAALNDLVRTAAARGDLAPVVAHYTKTITCQSQAGRSLYFGLDASLGGGEEAAFHELVSALTADFAR